MSFDLKPIFRDEKKQIPVDITLNPQDYENLGGSFCGNISVKGKISRLDGIVTLSAEIFFGLNAPCDRCAALTEKNYKIHISEKIADKLENGNDNDDYILVPDMQLDISETVITAVLLSLPGKYLCSNNCKGVCLKCGKNLNDGECDCTDETKDSRWAALSQLLD